MTETKIPGTSVIPHFGAQTAVFAPGIVSGTGTTNINWGLGNKVNFTFGTMNEIFTFTDPTGGACNLTLLLKQNAIGGQSATWPVSIKWPAGTPPTLSTDNNAIDIVCLYFDGSNYYGTTAFNFL